MPKPNKGFTLVEVLIVVTIIVILAIAILIGINPMAQIFKGYDSRRKDDLQKIKIALENYYSDHDCYPNFNLTGARDAKGNPSYVCNTDFLKPYLDKMPCDPNLKTPYTLSIVPPTSTCPQSYAVYAQIYAFFDKNANAIPFCPKTIAAFSPNISEIALNEGCSDELICDIGYGCINSACIQTSDGNLNPCRVKYCESDCNGVCANPDNACY